MNKSLVLFSSLFLIVLFTIFSINTTSAFNFCHTYDDFSSGNLNNSKWTESTFHGDPFTDEHFVNTTAEVYQVKQNTEGDAETNLIPNRQFVAGESFSYEVTNMLSGSGNHASQPLINGNYPPYQLEECNYRTAGCGVIGYWNDFPDLGDQIGTYKITYEFSHDQVKMTAIRPDNITVINTFTGNSEPYTLAINTHTGHNGKLYFNYDNVIICEEKNNILPFYLTKKITPNILYDDFSSGVLNTAKWLETPGGFFNKNFTDEHLVDPKTERYHTAQLTQADRGVTLTMKDKLFKAGDSISYNIFYVNGSGNRFSYLNIDGKTKYYGIIGYFNGNMPGGNVFGKYKVKVTFTNNGQDVYVTDPSGNNLKIDAFPSQPGKYHTFGFGTATWENGLVNMDYDNVYLNIA